MRQYFDAKRQYRDALVFFRMGDFYEMFFEDALTAARALELTLTSRSKDASGAAIPMCGVPFHAADGYIARLVRKGFRVAVVEQVEDPKKAKGLVRREVVRVVSPGTLTDAGYLDAREPAFLMALAAPARSVSASRCWTSRRANSPRQNTRMPTDAQALVRELSVLRPREIVAAAGNDVRARAGGRGAAGRADHAGRRAGRSITTRRAKTLLAQLRAQSLAGLRARRPRRRGHRGGRPRAIPARHAESRARARARHQLSQRSRLSAHRRRSR